MRDRDLISSKVKVPCKSPYSSTTQAKGVVTFSCRSAQSESYIPMRTLLYTHSHLKSPYVFRQFLWSGGGGGALGNQQKVATINISPQSLCKNRRASLVLKHMHIILFVPYDSI